MKATSLLEAQHRNVEALFEKLERGRGDRAATLDELANNLAAHMAIEQDLFYPAVKMVDPDLVNESYEEHALAELALKRVLAASSDDASFKARLSALKDLIQHHVAEEEEELLPQVEEALGDEALAQLAKAMKARFDEVYETGFAAAMPKGTSKTSADIAQQALSLRDAKKDKSVTA